MNKKFLKIMAFISVAFLLVGYAVKSKTIFTPYRFLVTSTSKEEKKTKEDYDVAVYGSTEFPAVTLSYVKSYEDGEVLSSINEDVTKNGQKYNVEGKTIDSYFGEAAVYPDNELSRAVINGINSAFWDIKDGKSWVQSRVVIFDGDEVYDYLYNDIKIASYISSGKLDTVSFDYFEEVLDENGNPIYGSDGVKEYKYIGRTKEFNCNNCFFYGCPEDTKSALERAKEEIAARKLG